MIKLYNCDNAELMAKMPDESIDVICIDPPYLYLKNQKLERVFVDNGKRLGIAWLMRKVFSAT